MEIAPPPALLLAEADPAASRQLAAGLRGEGFMVVQTPDFAGALRRLATPPAPSALLFDPSLPEAGTVATIRNLAARHPGLVLALRSEAPSQAEEATLLDLGADLYLAKGLPVPLLAARLRAALRRAHYAPPAHRLGAIPLGDGLIVEPSQRAVRTADGTLIPLSRSEVALIERLAEARGALLSRETLSIDILDRAWRYGDRAVDNLVLGLRRKLGMDADFGPIRSVRGVGYRLVRPAEAAWPRDLPEPVANRPEPQNRQVSPAFSR